MEKGNNLKWWSDDSLSCGITPSCRWLMQLGEKKLPPTRSLIWIDVVALTDITQKVDSHWNRPSPVLSTSRRRGAETVWRFSSINMRMNHDNIHQVCKWGKKTPGSLLLSVARQQFCQDLRPLNNKHLDWLWKSDLSSAVWRQQVDAWCMSLVISLLCKPVTSDVMNNLPNQRELSHSGRRVQDCGGIYRLALSPVDTSFGARWVLFPTAELLCHR